MPSTLLALQLLLILLPGFSAAYVVQALATRRQQSDLERVIEALVFSFIIYVCYLPINSGGLPFSIVHDPGWESRGYRCLAIATARLVGRRNGSLYALQLDLRADRWK